MKNQNHTTPNLGNTPTEAHKRDAIHIAVAPVKAGRILHAGDFVKLNDSGEAIHALVPEAIGVVDAFLQDRVRPGDTFWLMLFPQTITSLRHEWTHPAFEREAVSDNTNTQKAESEKWLRNWAVNHAFTYDYVLSVLNEMLSSGYACAGDDSQAEAFNEDRINLLLHASIITGKTMEDVEGAYFSCSC